MVSTKRSLQWPICDMHLSSFITGEFCKLPAITFEIRTLELLTGKIRMLAVVTGKFRMIKLLPRVV